jgi:hypothetical protein
MRLIYALVTASIGLALLPVSTMAGQPCPEQEARNEQMDRILRLATAVRDRLEESGAAVAYIARAGIDLREYGLVYSHLGLAWRDHPKGRWFTFHLLNPCNTEESKLADHSLEDFYKVDLFTYDALVAIPSPELQLRLLKAFFGPLAGTLHHPKYNMISYPFSTRYQNSNQWVLEVSSAALGPENKIHNRYQAQMWLKDSGYEPTRVYISRLRRLGAKAASPHIHFDDHTDDEHRYNHFLVVTADSIIKLLERHDRDIKLHKLRVQ